MFTGGLTDWVSTAVKLSPWTQLVAVMSKAWALGPLGGGTRKAQRTLKARGHRLSEVVACVAAACLQFARARTRARRVGEQNLATRACRPMEPTLSKMALPEI